jgi:type IV pilus assembly protein PilB
MKLPTATLKNILVGGGFVPEADFDDAQRTAINLGRKIEDIIVFRGFISEDALGQLISENLKVPYANLGRISIPDDILSLIPEKLARSYHMVPFAKEGATLKVAMEDPFDFEAVEFVKRHTSLAVETYLANSQEIRKALGQYKKNIGQEFSKVIEENIKKATPEDDPVKAAEKLPIIKVLDTIFEYAVSERASDIHIETQPDEVVVRFRIDGALQDIIKLPRGIETALVARIKILSNLRIDEHRIPQDGRYKFRMDDEIISLRISIIPGFYGENVVMRLLAESARPLSLAELGISGHNLELIKANMDKPNGMILVTGPTGSGKTTTLYSILNILNEIDVKICTIEDPIEYTVSRITQIQVNPKVGMDFAAGLRALLRHDPDIIMVGEIRDQETAQIAVHAALTGHLVLSTLHTNDASGAVPRLLDMGVEGYLVASTTNVIVAQRLVRKLCSSCLVSYIPDKEILGTLTNEIHVDLKIQKFYHSKGCPECKGRGFKGRIGIYEVLSMTDELRKLVSKRVSSDELKKQAIEDGMVTMLQDGLDKVASGLTTIEEVLSAVLIE